MSMRDMPAVYACGQTEVDLILRQLWVRGVRVRLSSRAFDVLATLVQSSGKLVTKEDFKGGVWAGVNVEENTLQVHISAIRRALGSERELLKTVSGRGYRLLGNWITDRAASPDSSTGSPSNNRPERPEYATHRSSAATEAPTPTNLRPVDLAIPKSLPSRLTRVVGRDAVVQTVVEQLTALRFVSLIGPGGIGKTTVAVAVGQSAEATFSGAVCFVDLGAIRTPSLAVHTLATVLGIVIRTEDPVASIIAFLRDRRFLLILDSCEHVISDIAGLAERIYKEALQVSILATSREALRVEGEHVHDLLPLQSPPEQVSLTADKALAFPAIQLFVERAAASGGSFRLTDAEAPLVAGICRGLEGLALAIELAARRAAALGAAKTAELLGSRFQLQLQGHRTAPPRHRTLAATLDWSYELLSDDERLVLRRFSTFAGTFVDLESVLTIIPDEDLIVEHALRAFQGLVSKSLVTADLDGSEPRFRLLDTTRTYARMKLDESDDSQRIAKRHAIHFRDILTRENITAATLSPAEASAMYIKHLGNVRAALEWTFDSSESTGIAISLAAAAAPLFLRLSLLPECCRWTELAIALLDNLRGTDCEMALQAALGQALMFTSGNSGRVEAAFQRSLHIAERIGDIQHQVQLLGWLNILHLRMGDFMSSLADAERCQAAAAASRDPAMITAANAFIGNSYFFAGRNRECQDRLDAASASVLPQDRTFPIYFGYDYRSHARICRARNLWILGYSDQAVAAALLTIEEATARGHPVTLCVSLLYAATVFIWRGEYARALEIAHSFIDHSKRHSLAPYYAAGLGLIAQIDICTGQPGNGASALRESLNSMEADQYGIWTVDYTCEIAKGLAAQNKFDPAIQSIDLAHRRATLSGNLFSIPEILRIKAEIILSASETSVVEAESLLVNSLRLAASQSAAAWELRTATSLSRLWNRQDRAQDARLLLTSVYSRFTEGFTTLDLCAAKEIIDNTVR